MKKQHRVRCNDRENVNIENLTHVEAEFNETLAHVDNVAPAEGVASTLITGVVEEDVGGGVDDEGVGVEGVAADGAVAGGELVLSIRGSIAHHNNNYI